MRFRLRTLLLAILTFNVVAGYAFLQAEAVAVNRASNEHGHIADVDERIQKFHEAMGQAWHRVHFTMLVLAWSTINIVSGGSALAAYVKSRRK